MSNSTALLSRKDQATCKTAGLWMRSLLKQVQVTSPGCKWHHDFTEKVFTGWGTLSVNANQCIHWEQRSWYQATDRFIMLGNKCQTLYNQPGACALVGFNMGEILSKKVKALTQCVHNPHLQANIIGGEKTWFTHADRRRRKSTVLFDKLCKLGIDMYCSRSCQKQRWFKVPDKLKAAHSAARSVWCTRKTEWERNEISGTTTLSTANSRVLIVKCTIIKSEQQAMCCCVFINKLWHEWS